MGARGASDRGRGVRGRGAAPLNRTVLVTGGAGFIGASLVRQLAERGDRVRVLDNLSVGSRAYLEGTPHEFVEGSLANGSTVSNAVEGVDAVVHLAARADVADSIRDPAATFDANVIQTFSLLEAARRAGASRFVLASSNAVFGAAELPVDETTIARPISPYGASKLAGESFCAAYAASYGLAACALRFSNVYGPYALHKSSVVAAWLGAAFEGRPLLVNGDGRQTRDYVYVGDLANAICTAVDAPADRVGGEVFQIGTGKETSLNELAQRIAQVSGRDLEIVHGPARAGDVARNVSRVDKARRVLGFTASVELADGLDRTARWWAQANGDPELAGVGRRADSGSE